MGRPVRVFVWTLLIGGAVAALVVFGLAGSGSSQAGRLAPALPRERLAGAPLTLAGLLQSARGRPALVVFWASWCGPCAREAPAIERLARSALGRGRVVAIDWSDPETTQAEAFVRRYAWSFPVLRDASGSVGNAYRITVLPTSFVIAGDGRIRAVLRGPQTQQGFASALRAAERA